MRAVVSSVVICALLVAVAAHREWGSWESQDRAERSYGHFSQDEFWDKGKETNDIGSNGKLTIGGMERETNRVEENNDLEIMMETYNAINTTTVSGPTTSKPGSTQTTVMPGPEQTALSTSKVIIMSTLSTTTATTTPTTTTQFTTTKNPPRECLNGGTFDGIKCICTSNFYGPSCEFADDTVEGPTTSKPESEQTTSKPGSEQTTSKPESEQTTSKPGSEQSTSKPGSEQTTSKPESGPTTDKPESGPTTSKPESGPTTSKPESEPTTSKPESGPTTSKLESGPTTSKLESGPTTSKPGSTQTTVMPGPEQTALSTSNVIIMSTLTTTATTTTPTTTTTTTQPTTTKNPFVTPRECQNGGTFDGTRCHCTSNFYGPSCEFADDRVEVGNKVIATVQVNMKITNKEFVPSMEDNSSPVFKEFEEEFKAQMKLIYSNVSNYKDVIIRSLSAGSIVVDYDIILEMEYNSEVNVAESYQDIVKIVEKELLSSNCFNENSFCFQNLKITTVPVPTYVELCRASIEPGYRDFYTAIITPHGLLCMSHCNEESPQYHNCNSGDCKLEKTGPECLCPKTDIYLYTTSRCKGRILKAGLYGGVGAGMAVLAIIILTLGILLCKAKQPKKRDPFSKDQGFNKPVSEPGDNDTYENIMDTY